MSTVPPVGSRYYWRVRACIASSCSDWTEVRYLDVGRQAADYDGDGYADLAVGAPNQSAPENSEGSVFVFTGSGGGMHPTPTQTLDNPNDEAFGSFGTSVANAGDINGDGYNDLIVGAFETFGPRGRAYIFFGGVDGVGSRPDISLVGNEEDSGFGFSVSGAGDVNADGYADVVIGAYRQNAPLREAGSVFVYFGGSAGPGSTANIMIPNPTPQASAEFGFAVVGTGDLNGDGYADLAVGARYQASPEVGEGNVFVFFGGNMGPDTAPAFTIDNPSDDAGGQFGYALAGGADANGDGYADLLVGAPYQIDVGHAFLFLGGSTGIMATPSATLENSVMHAGGNFGTSVGIGDLDGDGFADAIVGAPDNRAPTLSEGNTFVFFGGAAEPLLVAGVTFDNPTDQSRGRFGATVSGLGDTMGTGYIDLVVGAPGQRSPREGSVGVVFTYFGGVRGPGSTPNISVWNPENQEAGFGNAISR